MNMLNHKNQTGGISILILVLGLTISITVSALVLVASILFTSSTRTEIFEKSLSVAQAGIEYYKWHLNHNQNDYTDNTGHSGPYEHTITDPEGVSQGIFSLTIDPPATGSSTITITSVGWLVNRPDIKRTVVAKYGIPTLTKYSFINNSNMWFGDKDEIYGPVYSNGGIRMDGTHDSTVESAKLTYTCGLETGCDSPTEKPGIWGEGGSPDLWKFPVGAIDFKSIPLNFNTMMTQAQQSGVYLGASGSYGYHIIFNDDGTYTISKITKADSTDGWSVENGCETLFQEIKQEQNIGTHQISQKNLIFAEDHLWIDGVVKGKVTVVAARFPLDINHMNIWINNNTTYQAKDGSSNLGLIAQNDIIFPLDIPNTYEINGALFAHGGKVIRHNYKECGNNPHAVRSQLIIYGSIISNLKSYWSYGQGPGYEGGPASGFAHRDIIYDSALNNNPPPYFPSQGNYQLLSWEEK